MSINVGMILAPVRDRTDLRGVPDVVGLSAAAALDALFATGLRALKVSFEGFGTPGIVAAQAPPAWTTVRLGTVVAVYVPLAKRRRTRFAPEPDVVLSLTYADPDVADAATAAADDVATDSPPSA